MHKLTIVIIEDEPIVMAGLCSIINSENSGWVVVGTADNGQQGLKVIRDTKPDIILTDIRMPYLDGLELIKRVRQQDEKVIVIILTGHADFSYAQLALKYAVFDYILKPSSPKEIINVLEKAGAAYEKLNPANIKDENKINKDSISSTLKDLVFSSDFLEHIRNKDITAAFGRFMKEADRSGFWSLDVRKAIIIVERIFTEYVTRLADDRMFTLNNLMEFKQFLIQMYQITEINKLQDFSKALIGELVKNICYDSNNNFLIKKALEYVNQDIARDISLKDIADKMFLNYSYFSQLFKKETSMNFSDYLIYTRMEKARELLSDIKYKTYEVANNVGYNNAKHFSYSFRRIYGMSPSEYKSMFSD